MRQTLITFTVLLVVGASPAGALAPTTVRIAFNAKFHRAFLVDASGRTLYMFSGDPKNKPTCIDNATLPDCLKEWPPLLTSGAPSSGAGARQSLLGTAKRPNGLQVTYAGHPLYYFRGDGSTPADKKTGDVHGEGYVNEWWVLASNGKPVKWALPYSYTHPS